MISRFFIDRPIFATVLSVVITLIGGIALLYLPVAQYPRITPPGVVVSIAYPGASAQVVADTVAAPIEQQVNGVEGMLYMSSQMGNDGTYSLSVTFDIGVDLKTALVMVQNRVALAMPQLPSQVQNQGITIRKKTPDILMIVNLYSPRASHDDIFLSNFATLYVKDELLRVEGVSDVTYQGQRDYSIRAWLDPQKLAARSMTAMDVAAAIRSQNLDAPIGQIGQPPIFSGQSFQLPTTTLGRLNTPEQFGDIIIKVGGVGMPAGPTRRARAAPRSGGLTSGMASSGTSSSSTTSTTSVSPVGGSNTDPTGGSYTTSTDPTGGTAAPTTMGDDTGAVLGTTGGATTGGGAGSGGGATTGGGGTPGSATSGVVFPSMASSAGLGSSGGAAGQAPPQPSAAVVRLRDVARLELGAQNYNQSCTFDGHQAVGLSVYQLPGTNALDVAEAVRAKMEELKSRFPDDVEYAIGYDTTPFIRDSVMDVVWTLLEAVGLVGIVVLFFLQDWRAMILPLIDVPVSIIGTFAVMAALGFSLNNISLFGLVLAIGIVVDDAIVVLENIERLMATGLDARTATIKAMEEVTGPIVAVSLVLCAVFVPCAFIKGITGQFFHQFAVTIAVSTVISAINAVTMTPSRAVLIFKAEEGKPHGHHKREALPWWIFAIVGGLLTIWFGPRILAWLHLHVPGLEAPADASNSSKWVSWALTAAWFAPGALVGGVLGWFTIRYVNAALGWFFRGFNLGFDYVIAGYGWTVGKTLRVSMLMLLLYGGLLVLTYWTFQIAPTGFIPQQDQGRLIVNVQLPDSTSLQYTEKIVAQVDDIARHTEGVAHTVCMKGLSFLLQANSSNFGSMFIVLDPFDKRQRPGLRDTAIMARLRKAWAEKVPDAVVTVLPAAPIPGLGSAGGFKLVVEDRGGLGLDNLQAQTDALIRKLKQQPGLVSVTTQFRSKIPQYWLDIDRTKAAALGVAIDDLNQTLNMYLGSLYVNSYNDFGRYWQVTIQADGRYRTDIDDINLFQVRNNRGQMVPLGSLVQARRVGGPISVSRYNLNTAASISGNIQGVSTGDTIKTIDKLSLDTLPLTMRTEWTEIMFMQIMAGNTALYVFLLSIISVFLALAALYESWSLPLAVILVVPLCLLCSVAGVLWTARDVNIFVQIGLVVLVGLACKNAILVVEYARQQHEEGKPVYDATKESARLRLRPILMTSFAFIFGVVPLVIASGAGAEMRRSLGTAVFSGMLGVTLFGIFLTPVFFYVIQGLGETRLFAAPLMRWSISTGMATLSGAAGGYLLGLLKVVILPWGPIVGGLAAFSIVAGLLELKRRMRPAASKAALSPPSNAEALSEKSPGGVRP
jgi:multidrug efflux pump